MKSDLVLFTCVPCPVGSGGWGRGGDAEGEADQLPEPFP